MAKNSTMVMMKAAVSSSGLRPCDLAELDVGDRHGLDDGEQLVGVDPGGLGPVVDGDELDGAGDDRLELLVGALAPLELPCVDDEHVDVAVADGGFAVGAGVVAVDADRGVDGVALCLHGGGELRRRRPVSPTSLVPGPVSSRAGRAIAAATARSISSERREEGAGAAALADLAGCDEPALAHAVHAATAWRNSSDSVGGS